jgi:hypothetical protein
MKNFNTRWISALFITFALTACGQSNSASQSSSSNGINSTQLEALPIQQGVWSGQGIQMVISEESSSIQLSCASGLISGPLVLSSSGSFQANGIYSSGVMGVVANPLGGSGNGSSSNQSQPVVYSGVIDNNNLTLKITFSDSSQVVQTYQLQYGSGGALAICM